MASAKDLITKIILKGATDPSLTKAFQNAEKLTNNHSTMLQKAGDTAKKVAKLGATAIAAGTTATVAIVKSAIDSYADYEQLVGGVETLFKDSSDKLIQYANVAYKTAGLSQNEYMSTITSFSAAMINSLGGDTAKATELSNQAVIDMSDNANKMGTDMESIMNTYQSLSRGQYGMLDNLKLGYGGTKKEMERLLADAEKLTGIKYDISNFSDVTQAIHAIQEEMGITGTTAKEASSTISGSISAMKSSWQNLLTAIASDDLPFDDYVNNFVDSVSTVAENLLPRISTALDGVVSLVEKLAPILISKIPEIASVLLPSIISTATSLITSLIAMLPSLIDMLTTSIIPQLLSGFTSIVNSLVSALPTAIESICSALPTLIPLVISGLVSMIVNLCSNFSAILQPLISNLPSILISVVDALVSNLPILIDGAISLILGIVSALPQICQALADSAPIIIEKVVAGLLSAVPQLISGFGQVIWGLIKALPQICKSLFDAIGGIFSGIGKGIGQAFAPIGESIKNFFTTTIPNAFNSVVSFFKELPSKISEWLVSTVQKISTWGSNLWAKAKEIGSKFINGVVNFFKQLPQKIGYVIGLVIGKIIAFGQKIWNFATVTIPQFIGKVVEWFKQLPSKIWTWLTNTISKITAWGSNMISVGKSKVTQFVNSVVSFFTQLPGKIWTWLVNTAQKVVAWGSDLASKGKQAATDLFNSIVNKIKELPNKLLSLGKSIVQGLWNGINNAKQWLIDKIKSFASGIVDGIKDALGIHSPSAVMEKLFKWVPVGAGNGIINNAKYAVNAVKNMGGKITSTASKIKPIIQTKVATVGNKIKAFGKGGTVTTPQEAIVGDKPETIVPHGNTPRNRSLLMDAARGVGQKIGGAIYNITFAPVINGGNASENKKMLEEEYVKFKQMMDEYLKEKGALAY